MSRDHTIVVSHSGLVTITGGKWTTYRKMARDAVDNAAFVAKLEPRPCKTESLRLHGWIDQIHTGDHLNIYGSDAEFIRQLVKADPELGKPIHPGTSYLKAEVVWAVKEEMAMTVEDVLARRLRLLFLDARVALEAAPAVAHIMAGLLGKDLAWEEKQVSVFSAMAKSWLP
jgi:glycerol-3-phosphate dehydrogenase